MVCDLNKLMDTDSDNIDDFLTEVCINKNVPARRGKVYTVNGISLTISQWAKYLNIDKYTIRSRLRNGFSFEDAISTKPLPKRNIKSFKYTYKGETKTLYAWAKEIGVSYMTLRKRYERGLRGDALMKIPNHSEKYAK